MKRQSFVVVICVLVFLLGACTKDQLKNKVNVLYENEFNSPSPECYSGTLASSLNFSIENGYYVVYSPPEAGWTTWIEDIFNNSHTNMGLESRIKVDPVGASGWGSGGFAFNVTGGRVPTDNAVFFYISYNGHYSIFIKSGLDYTDYVPWTRSTAIKQHEFNILSIILKDGRLFFYINDTEVYAAPTSIDIRSLDKCGLSANRSAEFVADYFKGLSF